MALDRDGAEGTEALCDHILFGALLPFDQFSAIRIRPKPRKPIRIHMLSQPPRLLQPNILHHHYSTIGKLINIYLLILTEISEGLLSMLFQPDDLHWHLIDIIDH